MTTGDLCVLQVSGTPERPRLAVYRSNNHIYAQVSGLVGSTVQLGHSCWAMGSAVPIAAHSSWRPEPSELSGCCWQERLRGPVLLRPHQQWLCVICHVWHATTCSMTSRQHQHLPSHRSPQLAPATAAAEGRPPTISGNKHAFQLASLNTMRLHSCSPTFWCLPQVIDDVSGRTLAATSTLAADIKEGTEGNGANVVSHPASKVAACLKSSSLPGRLDSLQQAFAVTLHRPAWPLASRSALAEWVCRTVGTRRLAPSVCMLFTAAAGGDPTFVTNAEIVCKEQVCGVHADDDPCVVPCCGHAAGCC